MVASPAKFYTYGDQRFTFLESDYKAQTALLSVNYYFRGQAPVQELPPEPVQVVAPLAPVDSDGDGVPDNLDQCPNTPLGEPVDEVGCPLPPPPPPCKTPEAGERVSLSGCGTGDVIVLRGVNFDFNKSSLTANAMRLLDMVADELKANPHIDVEIGGHTDSKGADAYNQRLSEQRAQSVRGYLIGEGVAAGQLSARGYGENNPIADNDTEAGRELNRRVELKIIGTAPARVTRGVNPQVESNAAAQDASLADEPIQEDEDVSGTDDQSAPAANEQSPPNDDLDGLFDF
ncbi:OmpA family protein [Sinimarinibacterium sp. NLF-5-8]|nr:OmpA family protein [Sinimarinibacterium sp. NLF-5-8]